MTKKYISPEHAIRNIFYKQPIDEETQINVLDEQATTQPKKKPEEQDNLAQDAANLAQDTANFALDISPFIGTARSGIRAVDNFNKGDYLGAAGEGIMTGIGGIGDALTVGSGPIGAGLKAGVIGGIKGIANLFRAAPKVIPAITRVAEPAAAKVIAAGTSTAGVKGTGSFSSKPSSVEIIPPSIPTSSKPSWIGEPSGTKLPVIDQTGVAAPLPKVTAPKIESPPVNPYAYNRSGVSSSTGSISGRSSSTNPYNKRGGSETKFADPETKFKLADIDVVNPNSLPSVPNAKTITPGQVITPRTGTDVATIPKTGTDVATIPKTGTDVATIPKTKTDTATIPKTKTDTATTTRKTGRTGGRTGGRTRTGRQPGRFMPGLPNMGASTPGQSGISISGFESPDYLHMAKTRLADKSAKIVKENTADDERRAIENVPRPKSDRNKFMSRNQEIKKKIIDENVKKKLIIKDAVKNGKDKNYSVELNPEYKHEKLSD
jgi:hypothetical protein